MSRCLSTETVEGSALPLESVDDVEGSDSLSLGVLGVGDGVTDDILEAGRQLPHGLCGRGNLQDLENTSGLLVDQTGDTLDTSSSSETTDSGLGNTPAG